MKRVALTALVALAVAAGAGAAPQASQLVFKDDFSRSSKWWSPGRYSIGNVTYFKGALYLAAFAGNDLWDIYGRHIARTPSLVQVDVDATKVGGIDINNMGIVCAIDRTHRYNLLVGSQGIYGVTRIAGNRSRVLKAGRDANAIHAHSLNRLSAFCGGAPRGGVAILTLMANGKTLFSVVDKHALGYPRSVGLFASSRDRSGPAEIAFDNLRVFASQ